MHSDQRAIIAQADEMGANPRLKFTDQTFMFGIARLWTDYARIKKRG